MTDHKRLLEKFDRFNEDYVTAYIEDREEKKVKEGYRKEKLKKEAPLDQFISVSNVEVFTKPERVSKRLSRMGICSRRVAEKLIE